MKNYIKYICVLLLLGLSTSAWAATITLTYDYSSDYNDMWFGDMTDASSYWRITGTALFSVPISTQPTSDITVTIKWQYYGSGNEKLEKVSATGTETSSTWTIGETSVTPHPGNGSTTNGVLTISKPASPTTLEGLDITFNKKTGKALRILKIVVSYTAADESTIIVKESNTPISSINFGTVTTDNGYKTINLSGTCLTTDDNYDSYFYVSISGTDMYNFSAAASTYGFVYSSPADISVSYEGLTEARTYTATLTITAYKASECAQYYEGESFTRDIPLSVTYDPPCTSRTITMSDFSKSYGTADFVPTHTVSAGGGTKTWTSSNTNVATIVSGKVHIVGAGSTTITLSVAASGDYCAVSKSCTMTVNAVIPTVTNFTASCTNNKITVANANASTVSNKGGSSITRYGYLYSTTVATPTYGASGVSDAYVGTNDVALNTRWAAKDITGLSTGTTYYVRAYATNAAGTGYSSVVTITTKCAVTYAANGGTGTTVDALSPYEKLSDVTVLANSFVPPSGKKFVDWLGSDANHYNPNDVINDISTDMTLTAQWDDVTYKDYVFACVGISVSSVAAGKALVTSRKDVNVMATNPIKVTITGAVSGHRVSFSNSVGLHFYKKVEGTGADAGKYKYVEATGENSFVTPLTNQEVYVSYNPTSDGTGAVLSALPFTISCDGESQEFNTGGEYVKARNLPENVVIAAKTNGIYSALPANMGTTGVNPKPVIVTVATSGGVLTASGPSTLGYKLWPVKTVVSTGDRFGTATSSGFPTALYGDRLRFAGTGNHALWANNSGSSNTICNDLTVDSKDDGAVSDVADKSYEWVVTTTEEVDGQFVYTLQSDQSTNKNFLRLWGSKWGTYSAGNEQLYLLPLTPVTQADIKVMEWGTNEIAVSYPNKADCSAMTAKIGEGEATTVTITGLGGDIYKLTGVGTLTSNAAKLLTLTTTESGNSKQALFIIPYIISSGTGTPTTMRDATGDDTSNSITRGVEVVVCSGAKFEVDATTKLMTSDMYVYPDGAFEIASGRGLSVSGLYLRGGHSWLGSSFAMPHAKINASIDGLVTGNGLNFDYYIDATKYYDLAVPKTMTWVPVTDETGNGSFTYWVKQYNGETRASTGKGWEWYNWSGEPSTWAINMGQGYLVAAQPPTGRKYFIMRFPLPMTLPDDESSKDPIPVTAYGMTGGELNPGVSANNAGWNLIANPFLTAYMKDADGVDDKGVAISGSIKTGSLEPEYKDGKPTGKYVWDETDGKKIRYVTTYDYSTEKYTQHAMSSTVLEPFTGFFIQVAEDCYVKFDPTGRQNDIIARRALKDNLPDDMEIGITASIGEQSDETIILLCDELSRDNALEFPDESSKIMNAGQLNFYTFAGTNTMYANGMTYAEGQEWNAAGLTATVDGEYTFSASKVNTEYVKAVMLKDMNTNTEYDLLMSDVTIYLEKGTIDGRFAIKIVLKSEEEVTTLLDQINEDGINRGPEKFIYNDVMYIRHNGRIYDTTGRIVKDINK